MVDIHLILPAESLGIFRLSEEAGHLGLPLAGNTNDKNTVFAGSIFSLAALSGYDTAYERKAVSGIEGDLFLLSSRIIYHEPGLCDLFAKSVITEDYTSTHRGNFKMMVQVEVWDGDDHSLCATFEGTYVVRVDSAS
ncbi:MAG TPA: YiiD C-terminal domain-containing protein [Syntrophorhabdaceae bacterium]|jgi:thioesterase domain-containing protein